MQRSLFGSVALGADKRAAHFEGIYKMRRMQDYALGQEDAPPDNRYFLLMTLESPNNFMNRLLSEMPQ